MITKTFELRDRATFIPVTAISINCGPENAKDRYLIDRAGYARDCHYVLLGRMGGGPLHYDRYEWSSGTRTFFHAHQYITEHFDELESGQVIDVEFILGETEAPKQSERPRRLDEITEDQANDSCI